MLIHIMQISLWPYVKYREISQLIAYFCKYISNYLRSFWFSIQLTPRTQRERLLRLARHIIVQVHFHEELPKSSLFGLVEFFHGQ